jgi:hypothetical protein
MEFNVGREIVLNTPPAGFQEVSLRHAVLGRYGGGHPILWTDG